MTWNIYNIWREKRHKQCVKNKGKFIPGTMPSVNGASRAVLIVTLWIFTLLKKQKQYALVQMQLTFTNPPLTHEAKLIALHLQYTGCMLQAGEFKNVKFEITISSECRNSRIWGRLWFSLWERNHCHHTDPWLSITPLFPGISGWDMQGL
jgi:hypothetical protein